MENLAEQSQSEKAEVQSVDSLLESLHLLCRIHGVAISKDALSAGLPLNNGHMTPSLVKRAATRANLTAKVLKKSLSTIRAEFAPSILLLEDEEACLFLGWDDKREQATVVFPELGEAQVTIPREELEQRYAGYAIVANPKFTFDSR